MKKFAEYSMVNVLSLGIDLVIVFLLTDFFGLNYLVSVIVGFLIGNLFGFSINKKAVFHSHIKFITGYETSFLMSLITIGVITFFTFILTEFFGIYYLLSRIISGIFGGMLNFFLDSKFTFKTKSN